MSNRLLIKKSSVATKVPVPGDLEYGELAINYTDEKIYFKNASNVIKSFNALSGSGTVTSVGGAGTVSGLTLTGTVTSSGSLTLGGTLAVLPSNFASQSATTVLASPTLAAGVPTFRTLTLEDIPDSWVKKSVVVATTANITLSAPQTVDGIVLVAGDRVLVKNQTLPQENGIYVVAAAAWTRSLDADISSEIAGGHVNIDKGTANGGLSFDNDFKTTDVLGTTAMLWYRNIDAGYTIPITQGGTGAITAAAARTALGAGTVTSVAALTLGTTGTDITSTVATGTAAAVITLNVPTASATNRGALSAADWTTFNNKVGSLTDTLATVTGRGATTATAVTLNGGISSYMGDAGVLFQSYNASAANAAQLSIKHNLGDVTLTNARGALNIGIGDVTTATIALQSDYSNPVILQRSGNAGKGALILRGGDTIGTAIEFGRSQAATDWGTYLAFSVHDNNTSDVVLSLKEKVRINAIGMAVTGTITSTNSIYTTTDNLGFMYKNAAGTQVAWLSTPFGDTGSGNKTDSKIIAGGAIFGVKVGGGDVASFTSGALTIGGATSGVTRAVVDIDGNFLSYYGAEATARIRLGRDVGISGGAGLALGGNTYALIAASDTNGSALYFKLNAAAATASTSPNMTLTATGLGIGTTSPNTKLDVVGVKNTAAINITQSAPTVANAFDDYVGIDFRMYNEVYPTTQFTGNPSARISSYLQSGSNIFGLDFWTRSGAAAFSKVMRLTGAGGLSFGSSGTAYGSSGQVLQSNGDASPTWVNHVTSIAATTPIVASASTGAVTLTHATSGATAGTYNNVTVNTFGHVTSGSNVAYLTSYTETDTLATVTGRGATTGTASSFTGGLSATGITLNGTLSIANATSPNTNTIQFGDNTGWNFRFMTNLSGTPTTRFTFNDGGNFTAVGTIAASNFSGTHSGTSSGTNTGDNAGVTAVTGVTPIISSGGTTPSISHATSGVSAGTYNNVTVNATGHVTAGSNVAYSTTTGTVTSVATSGGYGGLTLTGGTITTTGTITMGGTPTGTWPISVSGSSTSTPLMSIDNSIAYGRSGLQFIQISAAAGDVATTTNAPTADWWHIIRGNHANATGYYTDLALPMTAATNIRYRRIAAGASSGWITVLDTTNISSYAVTAVTATTPIISSGGTTPNITHATSGATAGTYNNVTVNTFGHVTAGSNTAYLTALSDTLATVTGRGATTSTASTFSGGLTASDLSIVGAANKYLYINPGNGYEAMVRYNGGSGSGWYVGKRVTAQTVGTESFHFYSEAVAKTVAGIDTSGNMVLTGSLSAITKSFLIDHPTKPGMQLRYGSLEGPENGVYIRGRLKGNKIELPEYWTKLVDPDSITVNLTAIGKSQDIYVEDIIDNVVYVGGENVNCFYTVFAERVDIAKLEVEIE